MSDFKSKMPDFNEITTMATKLFKDVKSSVGEIVDMYKQKRAEECPTGTCAKEPKTAKAEKVDKAAASESATDEKKE